MNTFSSETNLGWLMLPILGLSAKLLGLSRQELSFTVEATPIKGDALGTLRAALQKNPPTFAWMKDGEIRVLRLNVHGKQMAWNELVDLLGLRFNIGKGIEVVGKRWSRLFRPAGFWAILKPTVEVSAEDPRLMDGRIHISRALVFQLVNGLKLDAKHRDRLINRLNTLTLCEFTAEGALGQLKGLAEVRDDLEGLKIVVGAGKDGQPDWKKELSLGCLTPDELLVTIVPVYNHERAVLDIQSLSHFLPFLGVDLVTQWLKDDAIAHLEAITSGDAAQALGRLDNLDEDDLIDFYWKDSQGLSPMWPVKRLLMSGLGFAFPTMVRQFGGEWLRQLERDGKLRLPNLSGGRYYLTPDWRIPRGCCEFDKDRGVLVNPLDCLTLNPRIKSIEQLDRAKKIKPGINAICSGADLDDAYNNIAFLDAKGERWTVLYRLPLGPNEFVVLRVLGETPAAWQWPTLEKRKLPQGTPYDIEYGTFEMADPNITGFDVDTGQVIRQTEYTLEAVLREGEFYPGALLGVYANLLMVATGTTWKEPAFMPMRISDVSDFSHGKFRVKEPQRLTNWIEGMYKAIVEACAIPLRLAAKVPPQYHEGLRLDEHPDNAWNTIDAALADVKARYAQALEQIALGIVPPVLPNATSFLAEAQDLLRDWRQFWVGVDRDYLDVELADFDNKGATEETRRQVLDQWKDVLRDAVESKLDQHTQEEQDGILLSLASLILAQGATEREGKIYGPSDGLLFLSGRKAPNGRLKGMADCFCEALERGGIAASLAWNIKRNKAMACKERTASYFSRQSITVNGFMPIMQDILRRLAPQADDAELKTLVLGLIAQEREHLATGNHDNALLAQGQCWFEATNFRNGSRIGVFTLRPDGNPFRLGLLPQDAGYEPLLAMNQAYSVLDVGFNGSQLTMVLTV